MARKEFIPAFYKTLRNAKTRINNLGSMLKEIIGVWPLVLMIIGAVLVVIDGLIVRTITISGNWVWLAFGMLLVIYLALMVVTTIMMKRERQKLRKGLNIKVLFYNPIFLLSYIPCAIRAVFKRKVDWKKIPHGG